MILRICGPQPLLFVKRDLKENHICTKKVQQEGLGCFTPDNFPVFDKFKENVYIIADSNHGYKMIGVGKLVAE